MKVLTGIIVLLCVLAILPVTMCLNSKNNERNSTEYDLLKSLSSVTNSGLELVYTYQIEKDTGNYLIIGYPYNWLSFHAGPPEAVFDTDGTLVDFSGNPGDDPSFQEKWRGAPGKERNFSHFIRSHRIRQ